MECAWDWVREVVEVDGRVEILDDAEAQDLVRQVKAKFVENARNRWWWESLRGETHSVQYDDFDHWLELLQARLADQPTVRLIVTDNQIEPSGVVSGPPEAILHVLRETPLFEYALTDPVVSWLILDNHHDVLITVGDLSTG
jgi:hypothetical protein